MRKLVIAIVAALMIGAATLMANGVTFVPWGTGAGNTLELRMLELAANGADYVGFKAPDSVGSSLIWALPNADGTANQMLSTNGSGALGWADAGLGAWTTVPYNASNFTGNGSMTWTVDAADFLASYLVRGKTMIVSFAIEPTTVGGTPNSELRMTIPGGYTASGTNYVTSMILNKNNTVSAGGTQVGGAYVGPNRTFIAFHQMNYANWTLNTNNTSVQGEVEFEIQ